MRQRLLGLDGASHVETVGWAILLRARGETMSTAIHAPGCDDLECCWTYVTKDPTYVCNRCERRVGYCMGAHDDMPALCDDCAITIGHVEDDPDPPRQDVATVADVAWRADIDRDKDFDPTFWLRGSEPPAEWLTGMIDGNPIWQRTMMWAFRFRSPSTGRLYTLMTVFARPWRMWR